VNPAAFSVARLPRIEFGAGAFDRVPDIVARYGTRVLLVTGSRSFPTTERWKDLLATFGARAVTWYHVTVDGEPSPQLVDGVVAEYAGTGIDVVLGIGGGSALDAARAIAGLLPVQRSVLDYLEGVGPRQRQPAGHGTATGRKLCPVPRGR
jgi:alcohol dehydrogenase